MLLRAWGYQPHTATDGASALRLVAECPVHAVLLDIAMPGMDGWEMARRLRGIGGMENARLVAISGFGTGDHQRRSLEAGCVCHLTKPVDPELLHRLLSEWEREG
jgi:hypothetical protein